MLMHFEAIKYWPTRGCIASADTLWVLPHDHMQHGTAVDFVAHAALAMSEKRSRLHMYSTVYAFLRRSIQGLAY